MKLFFSSMFILTACFIGQSQAMRCTAYSRVQKSTDNFNNDLVIKSIDSRLIQLHTQLEEKQWQLLAKSYECGIIQLFVKKIGK